jgi:hypothetical protein
MPLDIATATNAPDVLPIGGVGYSVRTLTLAEWGELQAWLRRTATHPIKRATEAIEQARDSGAAMAPWIQDVVLGQAQREAMRWPPRIGTQEWLAALDSVDDGLAQFLAVALKPVALEECRELAQRIEPAELASLIGFLFYGERPGPKAPASSLMTDSTNTTPTPPSSTNGDNYSTDSPLATGGVMTQLDG